MRNYLPPPWPDGEVFEICLLDPTVCLFDHSAQEYQIYQLNFPNKTLEECAYTLAALKLNEAWVDYYNGGAIGELPRRGYIYGQVLLNYKLSVSEMPVQFLRFFEGVFPEPLAVEEVMRLPDQFQALALSHMLVERGVDNDWKGFAPCPQIVRPLGVCEVPEKYRTPPTVKSCEFYEPWNQKIWAVGTDLETPEGPTRRTLGPILPDEYRDLPEGNLSTSFVQLVKRSVFGWTNSTNADPLPEEVVPHEEPNWADWDRISDWRRFFVRRYEMDLRDRAEWEKARKRYRNSIKKPLLQLLNEFDRIAQTYEEIGDTDVREQIRVALNDGYVTPKDGFELPETFGMFEPDGNAQVGAALRQFLAAANKIAAQRKNLQTAKGRLRSIQDENVTSDDGTLYDEYWGYVDEDEFDEE
jgi:hypothetical protein